MKNFEFDEKLHRYSLDGRPLIGTTTVIGAVLAKPALIQWSANEAVKYVGENIQSCFDHVKDSYDGMVIGQDVLNDERFDALLNEAKTAHRKKKETGADIGSELHKWIETASFADVMPQTPEDPQLREMCMRFWEWKQDKKILHSELRCFSEKHWTAGTIDAVVKYPDGKTYLVDYKTTSGIYDEAFIQTAWYIEMLKETMPELNIDGMAVVNITKQGKLQEKLNYAIENNRLAYLGLLAVYKIQKGLPFDGDWRKGIEEELTKIN